MELKHPGYSLQDAAIILLIVPYGIETIIEEPLHQVRNLLIVPYGIETFSQILNESIRKFF